MKNIIITNPKEKKSKINNTKYIPGLTRLKISQIDILESMAHCKTIRESKAAASDINPELHFAKKYLTKCT